MIGRSNKIKAYILLARGLEGEQKILLLIIKQVGKWNSVLESNEVGIGINDGDGEFCIVQSYHLYEEGTLCCRLINGRIVISEYLLVALFTDHVTFGLARCVCNSIGSIDDKLHCVVGF